MPTFIHCFSFTGFIDVKLTRARENDVKGGISSISTGCNSAKCSIDHLNGLVTP